jgi:hypothetical protein
MHRGEQGTRYRILLIAPSGTGLPDMAREIAAIASQHDVNLQMGPVTEDDVRREAARGGYDIFWVVAHCDGACVWVQGGDGQPAGICGDDIVSYVAASGASLCVLNTCQSVGIARQILQSTGADVICTVADPSEPNPGVLDKDAMRTGVLFAGQLAVRGDYREAYERSKPGSNRMYLYLDNRERMAAQASPQRDYTGDSDPMSSRSLLMVTLQRLESGIGDIRTAQGAASTDIAVLRRDMESSMKALEERLARLERSAGNSNGNGVPFRSRDYMIVLAAAFISVLISLFVYSASVGR